MKKLLLPSSVGVALTLLTGFQSLGQAIDIGNATNFLKSLTAAPGGTLTMEVDRGGVHIAGADQKTVEIEVQRDVTGASDSDAAKILREEHVVINQTGNSISISSSEPASLHHFLGRNKANLDVHYKITVPLRFDLRVETHGGDIELQSLRGDVKVKTEGGNLGFEDVEGNVNGETMGGNIHARNCKSRLQLKTGGGNLKFEGIEGNLDSETMGGNIHASDCKSRLQLKTGGGNVTIDGFTGPGIQASTGGGSVFADFAATPKADSGFHTGAGSVTVHLPGDAALKLDARTRSGAVETDLAVQAEGEPSGDRLKGTISGGGPLLKLETGAGSIEIIKRH